MRHSDFVLVIDPEYGVTHVVETGHLGAQRYLDRHPEQTMLVVMPHHYGPGWNRVQFHEGGKPNTHRTAWQAGEAVATGTGTHLALETGMIHIQGVTRIDADDEEESVTRSYVTLSSLAWASMLVEAYRVWNGHYHGQEYHHGSAERDAMEVGGLFTPWGGHGNKDPDMPKPVLCYSKEGWRDALRDGGSRQEDRPFAPGEEISPEEQEQEKERRREARLQHEEWERERAQRQRDDDAVTGRVKELREMTELEVRQELKLARHAIGRFEEETAKLREQRNRMDSHAQVLQLQLRRARHEAKGEPHEMEQGEDGVWRARDEKGKPMVWVADDHGWWEYAEKGAENGD